MRKALVVLGWLWTLPNTLVWSLLALLGGAVPYAMRPAGVVWFVARRGFWKWFFGKYDAITVGACTISEDVDSIRNSAVVIRHERQHVYQGMWMGVLYAPIYGASCFVAWAQGGDDYQDNWMERQAYARQGTPDDFG